MIDTWPEIDSHLASPSASQASLYEYDELIRPARDRFAASPGVGGIVSAATDARTMAAFLLHFSALSVPITEPVEGWIRRAADRCTEVGLTEFGVALSSHAKAEAGHHQYHLADFAAMTEFWNAQWSPTVHPDHIVGCGLTRGGERYCRIHEENILGDTPFCQFAIEYEIELLPVKLGPLFVENCVRLLGREILRCMTFVTSHVEFDVGHTRFNEHFLGRLIAQDPRRLDALAAAGTAALDAFSDHLTECLTLSHSLSKLSETKARSSQSKETKP